MAQLASVLCPGDTVKITGSNHNWVVRTVSSTGTSFTVEMDSAAGGSGTLQYTPPLGPGGFGTAPAGTVSATQWYSGSNITTSYTHSPPQCVTCLKPMPGGLSGQRCRTCVTTPARSVLPVVEQQDLIPATKYARLALEPSGRPCFRGTGYAGNPYYTETEATCGKNKQHTAPDPDCECGFWVGTRTGSKLATWKPEYVALEVELGGTVMECARVGTRDSEPPWGYRAQWQRVLSVTLPAECGMRNHQSWYSSFGVQPVNLCDGPPVFLCAVPTTDFLGSQLLTACQAHVKADTAIKKPVSFLREFLQTEVRPGTVTDDAVPRKTAKHDVDIVQLRRDWDEAVQSTMSKLRPVTALGIEGWLIAPAGSTRAVEAGGATYTMKSDGTKWQVDRVDSPELDAVRKRADEVHRLYREGKLTSAEVDSLRAYVKLP